MLQEADYGLTDSAFQMNDNNRYAGDHMLLVKFFVHPKLDSTRSAEEGRPIYIDREYVQIMQPGNKDSIIMRPATDMDKQRFAEHYRKFKAREDQERVEGTLLEEWPGVSRSQVLELKFFNIRTVEQLANLSDNQARNIMGINLMKQRAEQWLAKAKDENTQKALDETKAELAALKEQLAQLQAGAAEKPRRRGRKPAEPAAEQEPGELEV